VTNRQLDNLVPDFVKKFQAYIPSKPDDILREMYGCDRLYRLNNNENPLGPPPPAAEAIRQFPPPKSSLYPSGDAFHVRTRLAERLDVDPAQIIVGNGANEVISFAIKAFCREGDNIVTADQTFAVYEWVAEFSGIEARLTPLHDYGFDEEALLSRVDDRTKMIFICNPNNPTGSYLSRTRLEAFLERVGGSLIVVVDEAYFEFVEASDYPDGAAMLARFPNLMVFRTFSKMYALAGLRIGYLVGSREAVEYTRRTAVVYSINTLAQDAALAALEDDRDHIRRTREVVCRGKEILATGLSELGLPIVVGEGNFMMIKMPVSDTVVYQKLMARGMMVRTMTGFRFPNWIRVSTASPDVMKAFVQELRQVLDEMNIS
jgi:histidinol-phosphate aminotransferase